MQGDQPWKRTECLRTYGHPINNKMGYNSIVPDSMSKFYFRNRTQISENFTTAMLIKLKAF